MEDGIIQKTKSGMPQGSIISPILSNIYLHYVLDLWFEVKDHVLNQIGVYIMHYNGKVMHVGRAIENMIQLIGNGI